jgi:hypothetical protein
LLSIVDNDAKPVRNASYFFVHKSANNPALSLEVAIIARHSDFEKP